MSEKKRFNEKEGKEREENGVKRKKEGNAIFFFFFLLLFFKAAPMAYGGSQARGQIGAKAVGLWHNNAGSDPHL